MVRMAFSIHCFGGLVLVFCKCGSFYRGIGYGPTINKAFHNMTFYRVSIGVK